MTRDEIVDAAYRIGLDSFSMQGLGEELGVSTGALYSHVANRDEVAALVGERVRGAIGSFESGTDDWREWLIGFAALVRRELGPAASTLLKGGADPAFRIGAGERGLQLLIDAGFEPVDAAYAVWLVVRVAVTGAAGGRASFTGFLDPTSELFEPDGTEFAALRRVHADLVADDDHSTFAFDLEVVLDGIAARLARATTHPKDR